MTHFLYLTPEILLPFSPLTSTEFELIRRKAQQLWQDETRWSASSMTTYSGSYREKQLDEATCNRLAQRVGQPQFEYKPTPLPGSSAYNTLPGHAGSQEAADGKGRLPDIASPSRDSPLNIKHKVTCFKPGLVGHAVISALKGAQVRRITSSRVTWGT
ncbi:uncharacterized protein C4orf51 homolog isoform X1 [Mus musculus]|uniref:uncharacterized protein C4orf51 homolog isoform X1 n=1 Tax=Mus musculus TaxID=10090 RepID=UPI0005AB9E77|nr:uncharacterized protein C4orf51 homolog isoform X1 [Mus musculus]|eukprot:XP_011246794.1 PREDICTED: uncharacterized protein C4orf51 homolog isoform X2 [Mus musculus]